MIETRVSCGPRVMVRTCNQFPSSDSRSCVLPSQVSSLFQRQTAFISTFTSCHRFSQQLSVNSSDHGRQWNDYQRSVIYRRTDKGRWFSGIWTVSYHWISSGSEDRLSNRSHPFPRIPATISGQSGYQRKIWLSAIKQDQADQQSM
jgi:hypothetical protein